MMRFSLAAPFAMLAAALALVGCTPLGAFNTLVPADGGVVRAADGVAYGADPRQKLDVYVPEQGTKPKGVVVFVYGGSWSSGRRQDYAFVGNAIAARGYVTVVPDYRLVPSHPYPDFVSDTASAVAWAHANAGRYDADPGRLFLVGHSAGAYNAAMVALAPEFLRAAGSSTAIVKGVAGLSGPYDFLPLRSDETRAAFGHVEEDDLGATQPVNRVGGTGAGFLLVHGAADDLVYPRNSEALAAALRRAGRRTELMIVPDMDHKGTLLALSRPFRDRAPILDRIDSFFSGL